MTIVQAQDLRADDGHSIQVFNWRPNTTRPVAVFHVLHGLGEHAGRYEGFAQVCIANNIAVVAHNHRGHGETNHRGHFADECGWNKVITDVLCVQKRIATLYPSIPVALLGHSMGSYIAQCLVMRHSVDIFGLVLSGTTLASRIELWAGNLAAKTLATLCGGQRASKRLNYAGIGKFNAHFNPVRTTADWLSRDEKEVDRFLQDPLCGGPYSNRLWADLTGGLLEIMSRRAIAKVPAELPLLILGGAQDPVGGQAGLTRLSDTYRRTGHRNVTLKIYPGGRHEMLNETNRDEVAHELVESLQTWLETLEDL